MSTEQKPSPTFLQRMLSFLSIGLALPGLLFLWIPIIGIYGAVACGLGFVLGIVSLFTFRKTSGNAFTCIFAIIIGLAGVVMFLYIEFQSRPQELKNNIPSYSIDSTIINDSLLTETDSISI